MVYASAGPTGFGRVGSKVRACARGGDCRVRGGLPPLLPDHEPFRAGDDCDPRRLGVLTLGEVSARLDALPLLDGLRRLAACARSRTWCAFVWFTNAWLSSELRFGSESSAARRAVGLVAKRRKLLGGPIASG